jgi:hypothetical protein
MRIVPRITLAFGFRDGHNFGQNGGSFRQTGCFVLACAGSLNCAADALHAAPLRPASGRALLQPQLRTNGYLTRDSVNRLFTCAINHHAGVLAAQARPRLPLKEASRVSRLGLKFKLQRERQRGQKNPVAQPLKAIRGNLPIRTLRERIRFC